MRFFQVIDGLTAVMFCLAPSVSSAEYRAYELAITDQSTGQARVVITTLDPDQYPGYHHVKKTEVVSLTATWMCRKRSDGFQRICSNPRALANIETTAGPTTKSESGASPAP